MKSFISEKQFLLNVFHTCKYKEILFLWSSRAFIAFV